MWLKVILLSTLFLIVIAPVLFNNRLKVEGTMSDDLEKYRKEYRKSFQKYKGPKTDERINRMLSECIVLMNELKVPISSSICPEVALIGSHRIYGRCCPRGSSKKYSEDDYYIEMTGFVVNNTEKSICNTLIHELLHTVPGGLCHTGEWRKWAKYVSEKTGYNIKRCDGDDSEQDLRNLFYGRA